MRRNISTTDQKFCIHHIKYKKGKVAPVLL